MQRGKNGVAGRRDFYGCRGYGYLCVDIRLRTATEVIVPISGIRIINDFTICVCLEDADIMLLLRMFCAFFFSFCSSFSPNLRSLLLSGNEHDNLNFNAMRRIIYFRICLIWSKSTKLQLLEISPKHCSEAVCTLLLRVAGTFTDVSCSTSTSEQGSVNT